jgi:hypothetical protein
MLGSAIRQAQVCIPILVSRACTLSEESIGISVLATITLEMTKFHREIYALS